MIQIRREIEAVVTGKANRTDNVLKNAPHTAESIASAGWSHPYSREEAGGDRNLFCSCPPVEAFA